MKKRINFSIEANVPLTQKQFEDFHRDHDDILNSITNGRSNNPDYDFDEYDNEPLPIAENRGRGFVIDKDKLFSLKENKECDDDQLGG